MIVVRFALVVARNSCVAVSVSSRLCACRNLGQATISTNRPSVVGLGTLPSVLNHTSQNQHGNNVRGTGHGLGRTQRNQSSRCPMGAHPGSKNNNKGKKSNQEDQNSELIVEKQTLREQEVSALAVKQANPPRGVTCGGLGLRRAATVRFSARLCVFFGHFVDLLVFFVSVCMFLFNNVLDVLCPLGVDFLLLVLKAV